MKRYIIADTHFGHENIIRYCARPFVDANHMNEKLIANWNAVVGNDDTVYMLGDFCMSHNIEKTKELVSRLNGIKILVMGNHDNHRPAVYVECGFAVATRKPMMVEPGVILMHEPFEDPELIYSNYLYFFGHVHDKPSLMDDYPNCRCVSVERINYRPTDLDEAIFEMRNKLNKKR